MTTISAENQTVALLTSAGPLPNIVANDLTKLGGRLVVLREDGPPRGKMMKNRARRLGWPTAVGQTMSHHLFKIVGKASQRRINLIETEYALNSKKQPEIETILIKSVNSDHCRDELRKLDPAVVAVYATQIIGKETLNCVPAPFINFHGGINPQYRGQCPTYWALVEGDADHAGFTIHLVDEGVDTGDILYQSKADFRHSDNIATYQHRVTAQAMPYFRQAIDDALNNHLSPMSVSLPSKLWFPPTLWAYLWNGITRGVW
ncbi:MAG: formyl transferase [Pseudomonadota bacterium]